MCNETRKTNPEIADFVARTYYYLKLSDHFDLTPNYICSIICKILNDEKKFQSDLLRATLNVSLDDIENIDLGNDK